MRDRAPLVADFVFQHQDYSHSISDQHIIVCGRFTIVFVYRYGCGRSFLSYLIIQCEWANQLLCFVSFFSFVVHRFLCFKSLQGESQLSRVCRSQLLAKTQALGHIQASNSNCYHSSYVSVSIVDQAYDKDSCSPSRVAYWSDIWSEKMRKVEFVNKIILSSCSRESIRLRHAFVRREKRRTSSRATFLFEFVIFSFTPRSPSCWDKWRAEN